MDRNSGRNVLLCVLKTPRDRQLLFEGSYRIPFARLPKKFPEYLAFYQPLTFGAEGKRIELYGKIKQAKTRKRIEILPEEKDNPNRNRLYMEFKIGSIKKLNKPIINRDMFRVSFGFTTLYKLLRSDNMHSLFNKLPMENIMAHLLKRNGIPFSRQLIIGINRKKRYRLDFAVQKKGRFIDIECDSVFSHSGRKQKARDKQRDKLLKKRGWAIIRLNETDILKNLPGIIRNMKHYGLTSVV